MSDMVLAGGTVVTAEASFRADVAVEDEKIAAVGVDLPTDGADVVDVSGALMMPGFIDGHTHLDMPFGGTVTSDDWDTGTAAAVAGGTTTLVDFSLQDIEGTLAEAVETWQGKAEGKARIDYGLHVAITNLTEAVKQEIPSLPSLGVSTIKIFMAYKGTPLYTADEDLFEAMQIAREALWRGLQAGDLHIFGSDHCSFNYREQKELGRDDFTLIPNGLPGLEERAATLWTEGVRGGHISEQLFVAVLSTNQARVHGLAGRKGAIAPGADADIVVWDPDLT